MANGRALTTPPAFTPLPYGLLSAAQDLSDAAPDHWQAGITYQAHCPDAGITYDPCLVSPLDDESASDAAADKSATSELFLRGATPFAVYARLDCSPVGFWDRSQTLAEQAIVRSEGKQIERAFSTGKAESASGTIDAVFPHLEADTAVVEEDGGATLQTVATELGAGAGSPLDIVEAIGELEAALADCYHAKGVIHVPAILGATLQSEGLITRRGDQLTSSAGHAYAIGAGYAGNAPDATSTDGVAWVYATGAVWYYRSPVQIIRNEESFERSKNTVEALAERRCLLAWDCCHFAVPVTTGGVTAGLPDQAGGI